MITAANATELASKAHAQRRLNAELRLLQPLQPEAFDPYVLAELVRTREEIKDLHQKIKLTVEPLLLEKLWRCMSLASERERLLAGRPLPGQYKPDKTQRQINRTKSILALPEVDSAR